jgi:hypothetical protein
MAHGVCVGNRQSAAKPYRRKPTGAVQRLNVGGCASMLYWSVLKIESNPVRKAYWTVAFKSGSLRLKVLLGRDSRVYFKGYSYLLNGRRHLGQ